MIKDILYPETVARPRQITFSTTVKVHGTETLLFISGQASLDKERKLGVSDPGAQTRQTIENLKAIVEAARGSIEDIVMVKVYLTDMKHYDVVHKVRAECFTKSPPASTRLQVSRLAMPELLVEIDAIAAIS